uniref:C2H2-type domain-containing protein n=1 Tax=Eptatretus burgeri TaxID=7764 RepID=A0A8C4N7J8_EPTBU
MPKGFLVKRTRRSAAIVCLRQRKQDHGERASLPAPLGSGASTWNFNPGSPARPGSVSPARPDSREPQEAGETGQLKLQHAELAESLLALSRHVSFGPALRAAALGYEFQTLRAVYSLQESRPISAKRSARAAGTPASRRGAQRKRSKTSTGASTVEDDVTTSPVLGLMITDAPLPNLETSAGLGSGYEDSAAGNYQCQLCRGRYPEPLALAQHRCCRMVVVEYRCDACGKGFSCPANLASHKRWHKPRTTGTSKDREPSRVQVETCEVAPRSQGHFEAEVKATAQPDVYLPCPHCVKTFRRPAYVRKHIQAVHGGKTRRVTSPSSVSSDINKPWITEREASRIPPPLHYGAEVRAPLSALPVTYYLKNRRFFKYIG